MVSVAPLTALATCIMPISHANQRGLQSASRVGKDRCTTERGRSSGVEHDLAKVGVEGSNPFARSNFPGNFLVIASGYEGIQVFSDVPEAKSV